MSAPQATIFQSFNARFSDPEVVGEKFVPSPHFNTVLEPGHTAVLGPRGSGKTTLLKMLTLPALLRWRGAGRDEILRSLEFLSVYIPASLTWSADYRSFSLRPMDEQIDAVLSTALFRHHSLVSLIQTWSDVRNEMLRSDASLSRFYSDLTFKKDVEKVRELAVAWGIKIETSTREGLRQGITERIKLLQRLSVEATFRELSVETIFEKYDFLGRHFFDDAAEFIDILGETFDSGLRLALCFDELEIASPSISSVILRAPRSIDQRLFIKFSAAPYLSGALGGLDPSVPSEKNDFQLVFLSSYASSHTHEFSEAMFRSIASSLDAAATPVEVFGRSFVDADEMAGDDNRYGISGTRTRKFMSLFGRDESFRAFAEERGLVPDNLSRGTEYRRAADVRKVLWPVLVREEFLFTPEERNSKQSKKSVRRLRSKDAVSDIYTGAGSLFALCEGNPRWIIGLMEPLIKRYCESGAQPIKRSIQKIAIDRTMSAFFALLSTIPISEHGKRIHSLVDLVDRVGAYFRGSVLGEQFNADPVLSFRVDAKVSSAVVELVGRGINIGAFVTRTDPNEMPYRVGEISGLKVRLSHIFAPRYKLPLVNGRTVNLSTILKAVDETAENTLLDLFGDKL